jgi:hypothetical protein
MAIEIDIANYNLQSRKKRYTRHQRATKQNGIFQMGGTDPKSTATP